MSIKEKITENMQLPKEIILNYPKLTVLGKKELMVNIESNKEKTQYKFEINIREFKVNYI